MIGVVTLTCAVVLLMIYNGAETVVCTTTLARRGATVVCSAMARLTNSLMSMVGACRVPWVGAGHVRH
jgi:hypothetical protein